MELRVSGSRFSAAGFQQSGGCPNGNYAHDEGRSRPFCHGKGPGNFQDFLPRIDRNGLCAACQVTGTLAQPQVIEMQVNLSSHGNREVAVREKRPNSRTAEIRSYHGEFERTGRGPLPAIWMD